MAYKKRLGLGAISDAVQRCPALFSWLQGVYERQGGQVLGWRELSMAAPNADQVATSLNEACV